MVMRTGTVQGTLPNEPIWGAFMCLWETVTSVDCQRTKLIAYTDPAHLIGFGTDAVLIMCNRYRYLILFILSLFDQHCKI